MSRCRSSVNEKRTWFGRREEDQAVGETVTATAETSPRSRSEAHVDSECPTSWTVTTRVQALAEVREVLFA